MHILRPMLIHVDGASGLRAADRNGFSDPFVVVHVTYKDDDGNIVTTFVSRSQKINKTLTPQWNFDVFLPGVNETMHIVMTVMDWDRFANDDFLGQAVFPVPSSKRIKSDYVEHKTNENGSTIKKIDHDRQHGVALAHYELGACLPPQSMSIASCLITNTTMSTRLYHIYSFPHTPPLLFVSL